MAEPQVVGGWNPYSLTVQVTSQALETTPRAVPAAAREAWAADQERVRPRSNKRAKVINACG